jgi:hypothetical protein
MTNRELITAALRMLSVLDADETAPSPADAALGLSELNDLMVDLASEGIDLGFPPQDNVSDDFPLGDSEAAAIKPMLAMRLLTFYPSVQVNPSLPGRAQASMRRLTLDAVLSNMEEASMTNIPLGESNGRRGNIITGD